MKTLTYHDLCNYSGEMFDDHFSKLYEENQTTALKYVELKIKSQFYSELLEVLKNQKPDFSAISSTLLEEHIS